MTPYLADPDVTLYHGDALAILCDLPDESVDCVVTSPPYWGLRDYGTGDSQIGLERHPERYVERMVEVFREVRRVLAAHGTVWLNLGDSYAAARSYQVRDNKHTDVGNTMASEIPAGLKQKDLVGIPWRVAFALQADGWYLRSDIIWAKPNPMPESVTDRPTKAHEYVFLLSKQAKYHFDQEAVREPAEWARWGDQTVPKYEGTETATGWMENGKKEDLQARAAAGRNIRSVWEIATQPYPEAHFATFPEELARRCIAAGCPEQGVVLDPFIGSGTVAHVARKLHRHSIGIDLNESYLELAARRLQQQTLFAEAAE